jgi:hypothetical protein
MAKFNLADIDTGIGVDVQKLLSRAFTDGIDCDIPLSYGNKIKLETATPGTYVEVYVDANGKLVLPEETSAVYNDSVYMYFGSGSDLGMTWDGTDFHIVVALDDSIINVGDGTLSADLKWFGATAAAYVYIDASENLVTLEGMDLILMDSDLLYFGDAKDVQIRWDGTDLDILALADDSVIKFGNGTNSFDVWIYGNTASDNIIFDASAKTLALDGIDLYLEDADVLAFGDAQDVTISWDGTDLDILCEANNSIIKFGTGTKSFDIWIYGASTADNIIFDASEKTLSFDGIDIYLEDSDILAFGTGQDVQIRWDATDLDILAAADDSVINFGNGTNSFDIKIFGNTASDYVYFNASDNSWEFGVNDHGIDVTFFGAGTGKLIKWDQANDELDITAIVEFQSTSKLQFGDDACFIHQSADGVLTIEADGTLDLNGAISTDGVVTLGSYITLHITDTDGAVEGELWYDASENKLKFYNGATVETITSS